MPHSQRASPAALGLGFALLLPLAPVWAEDQPRWPFDPGAAREPDPLNALARPHQIRLLGIQPAFLSDPLALQNDDPPGSTSEPCTGPSWLSATLGNDNPFFDLRQRGDPGGFGYYRLATQAKLVDTYNTIFSFGMQAVTPAGRESDGLKDGLSEGPTVLSPGFSLFYAFTNGTAVQGYVGKNVTVGSTDTYRLHKSTRCAMAVQQPLGDTASGLNNVYFFMEGLGRYRYDSTNPNGPAARFDVLPGMHWKVNDSWWLSGGVGVPVQPGGIDRRFWQFTCSFQF